MKKMAYLGFIISILVFITKSILEVLFENTFNKFDIEYIKIFLQKHLTVIIITIIVIIFAYIVYLLIKFDNKYKKSLKQIEEYKKFKNLSVQLVALRDEIEKILTKILQKSDSVSLYILHKDKIYNFITLPYNITGIHHQNKVFSKNAESVVGKSFLFKENSIIQLKNATNVSGELKKSISAYNLNYNNFLITIPYVNNNNNVVFSIQVIRNSTFNEIEMLEITGLLHELNDNLEKVYKSPGWENLIPQLKNNLYEMKGSFIFFDLSSSSNLLESLSLNQAEKEINNFITIMCDVALEKGGEIDKYTGDGAFITFNVKSQNEMHKKNAIYSAIGMVKKMHKLRHIWMKEYNLSEEYANKFKIRIGISSGIVRPFTIGHKDYKYETFIGKPIHTAYHYVKVKIIH